MHLLQLSHELASVITVLIAFSKVLLLYYIIINGHLACTLYEQLIERINLSIEIASQLNCIINYIINCTLSTEVIIFVKKKQLNKPNTKKDTGSQNLKAKYKLSARR